MIDNVETNDSMATVAQQSATVAPQKAASKKTASRKKRAKGAKAADRGKATKSAKPGKESKAKQARTESKSAKILELIGRTRGATLAEIMEATSWKAHSVRGFISTAGKKPGIHIESEKNDAKQRVYKLAK